MNRISVLRERKVTANHCTTLSIGLCKLSRNGLLLRVVASLGRAYKKRVIIPDDIHLQYKSTADLSLEVHTHDPEFYGISTDKITKVGIQGAYASENSPMLGMEYTCQTEDLFPGLAVSFSAPGNEAVCDIPTLSPTPVPSSAPTNYACADRGGMDFACFFNEIDQEKENISISYVIKEEPDFEFELS